MASVTVFCAVCDTALDPRSPAVSYRSLDKRWWCTDEIACIMRASIGEQKMQDHLASVAAITRALDDSWASLADDGWRWPA